MYTWWGSRDGNGDRVYELEDGDGVAYAVVRESRDGWHVTFPGYDPEPHPDPASAMGAAERMAGVGGGRRE